MLLPSRPSFQDHSFETLFTAGDRVSTLIAFQGEGGAEKLLVQLSRTGWYECFLAAFLGFWHPVNETDVDDIHDDFAEQRIRNLQDEFGLASVQLLGVSCSRGPRGTRVRLRFETGEITLFELDPSDPHSATGLEWTSAG